MGIGELLRSEREKKGLSLADVENFTKIRAKYIAALESESYEEFPGEIYRLGFLRNYARLLGLNPETIIAQYRYTHSRNEDQARAQLIQTYTDPPQRPSLNFKIISDKITNIWLIFKNSKLFLGILIAVVSLLLVVVMFNYVRTQYYLAQGPAIQGKGEPAAAPRQENLVISLKGEAPCWTQVITDGADSYTGTIQPGDTKEFIARESIWLRLGNPGGVVVYYNGSELPPLGKSGIPVTKEFRRDTKDSGA